MQMLIKRAEVAVSISDKTDFESKTLIRDKEIQYILVKVSINQEDITIINLYAPYRK